MKDDSHRETMIAALIKVMTSPDTDPKTRVEAVRLLMELERE